MTRSPPPSPSSPPTFAVLSAPQSSPPEPELDELDPSSHQHSSPIPSHTHRRRSLSFSPPPIPTPPRLRTAAAHAPTPTEQRYASVPANALFTPAQIVLPIGLEFALPGEHVRILLAQARASPCSPCRQEASLCEQSNGPGLACRRCLQSGHGDCEWITNSLSILPSNDPLRQCRTIDFYAIRQAQSRGISVDQLLPSLLQHICLMKYDQRLTGLSFNRCTPKRLLGWVLHVLRVSVLLLLVVSLPALMASREVESGDRSHKTQTSCGPVVPASSYAALSRCQAPWGGLAGLRTQQWTEDNGQHLKRVHVYGLNGSHSSRSTHQQPSSSSVCASTLTRQRILKTSRLTCAVRLYADYPASLTSSNIRVPTLLRLCRWIRADDPEFPNYKANYPDFLRRFTILTYPLQFLKDVVQTRAKVNGAALPNGANSSSLDRSLSQEEITSRREVVFLVQPLCIMSKNVQLPARMAPFRTLVDPAIAFAVQLGLSHSGDDEEGGQMIVTSVETTMAPLDVCNCLQKVLAAFRFFRTCLRLKNGILFKYVIKHYIFMPILDLTTRQSRRDNLSTFFYSSMVTLVARAETKIGAIPHERGDPSCATMIVEVPPKHLYVFESIFKSHRGARCALTWHEFTCAMGSVGFEYGPAGRGGAARKFGPLQDQESQLALRRHEPHDGKLTPKQQDRCSLCSMLSRAYGWDKKSFVARQPAPPAVARDAEGDAGGDADGVAGDRGAEAQAE
ncbi:hypothetical protein L226DRAFT_520096 [Lentinus tigrinus ALCF2SS1-7]|uniref:Serine/threonine-protein phosphatase 4 regulatory subunit 3-like central domain-containing protein n=1 Tax=Lentinus tigrinus ALCF2SS1-6 TaxID=1328759 RepID=A0A5C2SQD4_9APHY|nr:hypothetical protein L227DRAFT_631144 [Lentinus tigrinus ALCF2SS1-6]RPD79025.1 hypothetical protein L226DRAFT_520096 [Lentinus tigrinus ALCF2SS1-7]